jgi:hypothetical protein
MKIKIKMNLLSPIYWQAVGFVYFLSLTIWSFFSGLNERIAFMHVEGFAINRRTPSSGLWDRNEINRITPTPAHVYNACLHPPRNRRTKPVITYPCRPPSKVSHEKWNKLMVFGGLCGWLREQESYFEPSSEHCNNFEIFVNTLVRTDVPE